MSKTLFCSRVSWRKDVSSFLLVSKNIKNRKNASISSLINKKVYPVWPQINSQTFDPIFQFFSKKPSLKNFEKFKLDFLHKVMSLYLSCSRLKLTCFGQSDYFTFLLSPSSWNCVKNHRVRKISSQILFHLQTWKNNISSQLLCNFWRQRERNVGNSCPQINTWSVSRYIFISCLEGHTWKLQRWWIFSGNCRGQHIHLPIEKMAPKRVCLIGAGPSGMCVLYWLDQLKRQGVTDLPEVVCYEKQNNWGGLWNYTWRTGTDDNGEAVHGSKFDSNRDSQRIRTW